MFSASPASAWTSRAPILIGQSARIRRARIPDAPAIHALINHFHDHGILLPRSLGQIYELLPEFLVADTGEKIAGCCALHVDWADLAELRSLAVAPEWQRQGIGRLLVEGIMELARDLEIAQVFCLTDKPAFFQRLGFSPIDKERLPRKVWRDCVHCPIFPECTETALLRPALGPAAAAEGGAPAR